MKLLLKKKTLMRAKARIKTKVKIRKKVEGSPERPRLCIYRSGKHMYAQIVDDTKQTTLVSANTLKSKGGSSVASAKSIGAAVAKAALSKNVKKVVFDRSGYLYHGRVKAVADGAREAGLEF